MPHSAGADSRQGVGGCALAVVALHLQLLVLTANWLQANVRCRTGSNERVSPLSFSYQPRNPLVQCNLTGFRELPVSLGLGGWHGRRNTSALVHTSSNAHVRQQRCDSKRQISQKAWPS